MGLFTTASWLEYTACALIAGVAAVWLSRSIVRGDPRLRLAAVVLVPLIAVGSIVTWMLQVGGRAESHAQLVSSIPDPVPAEQGFVTSQRCQACHPNQYHTWHDSYHRTMTQPATPDAFLDDIDGLELFSRNRRYAIERKGDAFWIDMVDPEWEHELLNRRIDPDTVADAPRVQRRIVMTTGSHRQQTMWVKGEKDDGLYNVPFIWLAEDERWVPRESVFLRPADAVRLHAEWHTNCIECHSTGREWDFDARPGTHNPMAAELGIACEACHGPAEEHIRVNQDPLRRMRMHQSDEPDPTIVNPARLTAERSSMVCGQCHGMNLMRTPKLKQGERFRAGGNLRDTRIVLRTKPDNMQAPEKPAWPLLERFIATQPPDYLDDRFWSDGMVRVSGRDHNAMVESACFKGGELSCITCHSMHSSDPAGQLAAEMHTDTACLQCHEEIGNDVPAHTHHPAGTVSCYDCHMPHTVYGLLSGIRSHLIDSPTVDAELATGRPNACSLCHLDQPVGWVADRLTSWYGQTSDRLSPTDREVAAGVKWALTGNANQRALAAWHFGWSEAQRTAGTDWMTPFLAQLLDDPYDAVRYIAGRSLRSLPGQNDLRYDFIAPSAQRAAVAQALLESWMPNPDGPARPAVLLDAQGRLDANRFSSLAERRDDRRMDLRE